MFRIKAPWYMVYPDDIVLIDKIEEITLN